MHRPNSSLNSATHVVGSLRYPWIGYLLLYGDDTFPRNSNRTFTFSYHRRRKNYIANWEICYLITVQLDAKCPFKCVDSENFCHSNAKHPDPMHFLGITPTTLTPDAQASSVLLPNCCSTTASLMPLLMVSPCVSLSDLSKCLES